MRLNVMACAGAVGFALAVATVGGAAQDKAAKAAEKSIKANEKNVVVNIVGCVEREADYRKQINQGKGGPLNTGVGVGDEYILRYARSVPNGAVSKKTLASTGPTDVEEIYSVSGGLEDKLKLEVGHQVEATGWVDVETTDGSSKVHQLPRLHVDKWSRVAASCPTPKKS